MKFRVKLPKEAKELIDGVTSVVDLAGQAARGGTDAVRQAKKATRKARRAFSTGRSALDAIADVARAGRNAASGIRSAAREGAAEAAVDLDSGNVVVDLRGQSGRGSEGDDR